MTADRRPTTLRGKLVLLLACFAGFSVLTAAATIYGVQWRVSGAIERFEQVLDQTVQLDRLRLALKEQRLLLRDVVQGRGEAIEPYRNSRIAFRTTLDELSQFTSSSDVVRRWAHARDLTDRLEAQSDRCVSLGETSRRSEALTVLDEELESDLFPSLDLGLRNVKTSLDHSRSRLVQNLGATTGQVLGFTIAVGGLAAVLVIIGSSLIRRWLLKPVAALHEATYRFGAGELDFNVRIESNDELGALGEALNRMARTVADAQDRLQASERKHRTLFQNLRDAVVLCDAQGRILECHDGQTGILGADGADQIGRFVLDAWPHWRCASADWTAILRTVIDEGERFHLGDVELRRDAPEERTVIVDFLAYRVDTGRGCCAAIVIRDVSQRHRLQHKLRQAETMEAVGTLSGGLAHDFNNLLTSAIGTLSLVAEDLKDSPSAVRIQTALRACWQAAGLSRRLLNFAGSAQGDPQLFRPHDAAKMILDSLDPSFLEGVRLRVDLDEHVVVRMDRDQFTQIVLNLLRNARDAMPDGGELSLDLETVTTSSPDEPSPRPYAVLVVSDNGIGMSPETRKRVFEPFFTTKSRAVRRGRGMGLAIVYGAVRNAGGFIEIESRPGDGTTFRVHIPATDGIPDPIQPPTESRVPSAGGGTILLVDEDPVIRDVARAALEERDYFVITADSAEDAKAKIQTLDVDDRNVAVVDLDLSDELGTRLAKELLETCPSLRVVFMTASEMRDIPAEIADRVTGQIAKPFTLEALTGAVATAMTAHEVPR